MPLGTYYIESKEHYRGPPAGRPDAIRHIDPKDIKSMQGEPPTVSSYGYGDATQIFTKDSVVTRTANNRFETSFKDFKRNGYFSQIDDGGFGRWIKAATDNPPYKHSLIPRMPDFGLIESPRLGMYFPNEGDTPVGLRTSHDIVNAVSRQGYFQSKLANFEHDLRNLMFDKTNRPNYEAVEWVNFLAKKGFSIDTTPNPGVIGLGVEKGDFLAAYYPGKGYLVREENFHNRAKNLISRYGLTDKDAVEAMKHSVLLHEIGHVLGIGGNRRYEKLQGKLQAEFYAIMAERFKGTNSERIYRALAQEGRDYARDFSFWGSLLEKITEDSHSKTDEILTHIFAKFKAEARALELTGEEFTRYVNERARETYGAIMGGEPSYKVSKSKSRNNKNTNSKKLEEIVDESGKASFTLAEDGTLAPTYEGRRVYGEGARMPTRLIGKGIKESENEKGGAEKTYERKIGKSEYKSMKDARDRE